MAIENALLVLVVAVFFTSYVQGQGRGALRLYRKGETSIVYSSGIVEVFLNSTWVNICGPSFEATAADVICHQLGYTGGTHSTAMNNNYRYGVDTSPSVIGDVSCSTSNKLVILQCTHSADVTGCDDKDDVTVSCYSTRIWSSPYSGMVRLVEGNYAGMGRIEVFCNGQWGLVCYSGFTSNAANTVCTQLGYNHIVEYNSDYGIGNDSQPVWLKNVDCGRDSSCLSSCQSCPVHQTNCSISNVVGVTCMFSSDTTQYGSGDTRYTCVNSDSQLSVGIIIAIAIGAFIVCLVCTFLIFFLPLLICCCLGVGIGSSLGKRRNYSSIQ